MKEFCKHGHLMSETGQRDSRGYFYCKVCRLRRQREWDVRNRDREHNRKMAWKQKVHRAWIEWLETQNRCVCKRCGYKTCFSALDFHHINPVEKEEKISKLIRERVFGDKETLAELGKTITLCRNCHVELHAGVWKLEELNNV